jgi:mRNA interferase RelE/StbE
LAWTIEWDDAAKKQLKKLDRQIQKRILDYLDDRVTNSPLTFGKELLGNKIGLWRYRIDDYRVICRIENQSLVVLVLGVGHRKEIYD